MKSILSLLDESGLIGDKLLSNNQIVEIYKATTEEEAVGYMETIQALLDKQIVPGGSKFQFVYVLNCATNELHQVA